MEKQTSISKLEGEGGPHPTTSADVTKVPLAALELTPSIRIPPVWMLGIASGLSTFGLTITIPLLVEIANQFDADYASVQFVISVYMLGLALAQPMCGILCDLLGRRPVMLAGFALFVAASIGAALTDSLTGLIALRFLQAVGASVGTVVSRAVVRDTRDAMKTTVAIGHIAAVMGIAPIVAPVFGGWLGAAMGYRSVFIASAAIGLVVLVLLYRTLPETLNRAQTRLGLPILLKNYSVLLRSRAFLGFSMIYGFAQGSFFSFMTVGAAIFETELNMTARSFGTAWSLMALSYVAGAVISARLNQRIGMIRVLEIAVIVTFVTGCLTPVWAVISGPTLASVLVPVTILMISASGIIPGGIAGVVNAHPEMAGTASGLSNALALLFGGAFTVFAGILYQENYTNIAVLIAVSATLTALSWAMVRSIMIKKAATG